MVAQVVCTSLSSFSLTIESSHLTMHFNHTAKNSLVQMPIPASDGHTNGHHNGNQLHESTSTIETNDTVRHNGSRTISRKTSSSSHTHNFSSTQKVTVLRQTVTITRSKLIDFLTHVDEHYIDSMTVESFLEYIETERLTYMPRQGSRWDKVLKWAEFFALQISGYEKRVESFVPDSKSAAKLILAACRVLIEVSTQAAPTGDSISSIFNWGIRIINLLYVAWRNQFTCPRSDVCRVLQNRTHTLVLPPAPRTSLTQLSHSRRSRKRFQRPSHTGPGCQLVLSQPCGQPVFRSRP